jgi:D-alanine-D-alanine ligase
MKNVLILCGGRSAEHEISLISAKGILDALDRTQYTPSVVGISKDGTWYWENPESFFLGECRADKIALNTQAPTVAIVPYTSRDGRGQLLVDGRIEAFDLVFPILHGQFGEDGTLQGMLDFMQVPYVGAHCASSLLCMDKVWMKTICIQNAVPVAEYVWLRSVEALEGLKPKIQKLGLPLFVKPASQGSSVGISKVTDLKDLPKAVRFALEYDEKCLIEKGIQGKEIECGVLGRRSQAQASELGEIIPSAAIGWYSYEAKYILEDGARTETPARLSPAVKAKVQKLALEVFQLLECDGLARVDFFVDASDQVFLNEVNTLPGFTPISMYPKMWQASGVGYSELISRLLDLAYVKR